MLSDQKRGEKKLTYSYIFCEKCGRCCDIDYKDGFEHYICEDCGEVEGIPSESCLCIGCENFDEIAPIYKDTEIRGCCDVYTMMPFKMFKRKNKCKHFSSENLKNR